MVETYVVASPYKGRLLKAGKPVANQVLINELRWTGKNDPLVREITTDGSGFFEVAPYTVDLDLGVLDEFSGSSYLYLSEDSRVNGEEPDYIMVVSRRDGELGSEFGEDPLNMVCELTADFESFEADRALAGGKCRWDNMMQKEW